FSRGKRVSALAAFNHKGFLACGYTSDTFTCHTFHNKFVKHILPHLNPWPFPNSIDIIGNVRIYMYQEFVDAVASKGTSGFPPTFLSTSRPRRDRSFLRRKSSEVRFVGCEGKTEP
ncbi:hypothetical protein EDD21DRAFT_313924, partial [Dissophora ornata]